MKKYFFILILCVFPILCYGQVPDPAPPAGSGTNRIGSSLEAMLQRHKYKVGIFRFLPALSVNTGYDSNALYLREGAVGDYYISVQPQLSVGLKLGSKAFFELDEHLNLLWYKELDQRRDIYNDTHARFVTGSQRMLVTLDGGYIDRKDTYNFELDVPLDQRRIDGGITVNYTLTDRINLSNVFRVNQTEVDADEEITQLPFDPVDRRTYLNTTQADYYLKEGLAITTSVGFGRSESLETELTTRYWSLLGGLSFHYRRLRAHGQVGYGESGRVDEPDIEDRKHLLISSNLDMQVHKRVVVGAFLNRQFEFTVLSDDVTVVTNVGGRAGVGIPITTRLSANASYSAGYRLRNDDLIIDGEPVDHEFFQRANAGLGFQIYNNLSLVGAISYYYRDSDVLEFNNERLVYSFGVGYSTTF